MNEILASETEVRAATHSQDLGWVLPCPAPALLSSHFPHPCQEAVHSHPHLLSRNTGLTLRGRQEWGCKREVRATWTPGTCSSGRSGPDDPHPVQPRDPEPLREMHVCAGADGLGLHSDPDLVPPKLSDPGQVTAPERGSLTPPASKSGCEIRGNALKALDSQQALTKGGSSPTFPSCSVQGLWFLQGGP